MNGQIKIDLKIELQLDGVKTKSRLQIDEKNVLKAIHALQNDVDVISVRIACPKNTLNVYEKERTF